MGDPYHQHVYSARHWGEKGKDIFVYCNVCRCVPIGLWAGGEAEPEGPGVPYETWFRRYGEPFRPQCEGEGKGP